MARQGDMWTMINRELSRLDAAKGGASDTPYIDIIRDTMRSSKEDRAWKERKNEQMRSLVDIRTQGFSTEYHNPSLDKDILKYESWFKANQGNFDDVTMEYAQITLDNMKNQRKDNEDFDMLESQIVERREQMLGNLEAIDATGEKLTKENIEIIRSSNEDWINYTGEFTKRFGDRLSMKGFEHISRYLEQGANMNTFLLQSAKDDGWIDEKEWEAYRDSWEGLNTTPIAEYLKKEEVHDDTVSKGLQQRLMAKADSYQRLDNFIGDPSTNRKPQGALPVGVTGIDPDGTLMTWDQIGEYYDDEAGGIQKLIHEQRKNENELMTQWDDQYKKLNVGQSMITPLIKDFYPKELTPEKKGIITTPAPTTVTELGTAVKELRAEDKLAKIRADNLVDAIDSLATYRRSLGLRGVTLPGKKIGKQKPVEVNKEFIASVQSKIDDMATMGRARHGGVDKAMKFQAAWDNYLSAFNDYEKNKTSEDIRSEIKILQQEYGASKSKG